MTQMHLGFTMALTRLGADMTVLPSRPSIFLKLLVFWPVSAPAHFLSLSQIPLSLRRAAHTAPGLSAIGVARWPCAYTKHSPALSIFIYFWPHWACVAALRLSLVAVSGGYSCGRIQVSHRTGSPVAAFRL